MSSDDQIAALNKRKAVIKGQLTKLANYISLKGQKCEFDELNARLVKINELYNQFVETEDKIFQLDAKADSDMLDLDDQYFPLITKIQSLIRAINLQPVPKAEDSADHSMSVNTFKSDFKLPRLSLPTFDGNYKQWQAFYDVFISTVHENTSLSPAQKFKYLLGQLRGPAYSTICHFRVDDANYVEALKRLINRYDKKKVIVETYIHDFLSQPKITSTPSTSKLMKIYDSVDETTRGLKSLGPEASARDPWIIYLATEKLDEDSKQLWKYETSENEFPTIDQFLTFISKRMNALGDSGSKRGSIASNPSSKSQTFYVAQQPSCPVCINENHKLYSCDKFRNMPVNARRELMKNANRCYNCLSDEHIVTQCKNTRSCLKCNKRHNTLLHVAQGMDPNNNPNNTNRDKINITEPGSSTSQPARTYLIPEINNEILTPQIIANHLNSKPPTISILPTAQVEVEDSSGRWTKCRVLLDSGSTHSFITESCVSYLRIPRAKASIAIDTLNGSGAGLSKGVSNLRIRSCIEPNYIVSTPAYIITTICSKLPTQPIDTSDAYFKGIHPLADPEFHQPNKIDILLGCEHLFHALTKGKIVHFEGTPIARNTRFGWIIGGNFNLNSPNKVAPKSMHIQLIPDQSEIASIDNSLQRFWETEEIPTHDTLTAEEEKCLKAFHDNLVYKENRLLLSLPFNQYPPNLGDSYQQALRRFFSLENRLKFNPTLKKSYVDFLQEYLSLGHMEPVAESEINKPSNNVYYMPHHPVFKSSSTTTKVRVVFDASAKTTTGESLNDNLLVGPTIQQNLINILVRFRQHRFVISADIEKMFRQILIHPNDREYQRIIWRESPQEKVQHFRLRTVTYGTGSAPFLATQSLHYIADKFATQFPNGSEIVKRDFYMDDLMSGGETLKSTLQLQNELISLLKLGGFNLRKWSANHPALLANIPIENRELSAFEITDETNTISVLGIKYDPIQDNFFFRLLLPESSKLTKRTFLSETSRIFDPLGLLSPVTVRLKILFQSLWLKGIGWDDELPPDIAREWCLTRSQLNELTSIRIPRYIYGTIDLELHGFADASKEAYAAVIYARVIEGTAVKTNLIAAKTKVAPIKTVSIPRLELNAATLLVRLLELVQNSLCLVSRPKIYLYTDSSITLDWLSKPPKVWKTYVANRTARILTCTNRNQWHHIPTNQNPADCATRGILPQELNSNKLWFNGPDFLLKNPFTFPNKISEPESISGNDETMLEFHVSASPISYSIVDELAERISSYRKLTRITALLLRYMRNLRLEPHKRMLNHITATEIRDAEIIIFRRIQETTYASEIKSLKKCLPLNTSSNIYSFFLFIDAHGLLRVGGRLEFADVEYDVKHPIILPSSHIIIERMIREKHIQYFHAGPKLLLTIIKQRIIIPRARQLIRRIIHQCIVCCRHNAVIQQQLMGQLPSYRVNPPARAFQRTGIDLAGPFTIKIHRHRTAKSFKAYLVVYVCMSTKAVTLDLVSDMSTDNFIASLKRFCATRGVPSEIFCDNGSNLVGARNQLREFYNQYLTQAKQADIVNWCTDNCIQWHFIPPAAPTFGGLWEATVKSTKYHLRRVIGESILTYEEFLTLIKQVEALLNSRPLGDIHDDECNPLTPGHFLIGQPITLLPEPSLQHIKIGRLSRWQLIQSMIQGFWKRWTLEYITSLNKFYKWHTPNHQIKVGNLVLLREQNLPPAKWPLARISEIHPGADKLIRVVTVKLPNGKDLKRPVNKICLLPSIDSNESTAAVCSKKSP